MKKINRTVFLFSLLLVFPPFALSEKKTVVLGDALGDGFSLIVKGFKRESPDKYFDKYTFCTREAGLRCHYDENGAPVINTDVGFLNPWIIKKSSEDQLWISGEFSDNGGLLLGIEKTTPNNGETFSVTGTHQVAPIEVTDDNNALHAPFATGAVFGSGTSPGSEQMTIDGQGRIWLVQTGGILLEPDTVFNLPDENGAYQFIANYSRIVRYNPHALSPSDKFCIYNVPDNFSNVMGITWQPGSTSEPNGRIWFSQFGRIDGVASLVSMDPDSPCTDNDYSWTLENGLAVNDTSTTPHSPFSMGYHCNAVSDVDCSLIQENLPNNDCTGSHCFEKYPLPSGYKNYGLAHLIFKQMAESESVTNRVWFAAYLGEAVGFFDLGTSQFHIFHVGSSPHQFDISYVLGPSVSPFTHSSVMPWDLAINNSGDVFFTEYASPVIAKFDHAIYKKSLESPSDDLDCEQAFYLNKINPCMKELRIPRAVNNAHQTHDLLFDKDNNLWFGISSEGCLIFDDVQNKYPHVPASIGFIDSNFKEVFVFDHLWKTGGDAEDIALNGKLDASGRELCHSGSDQWMYIGMELTVEDNVQTLWVLDGALQKLRVLKFKSASNIYCQVKGLAGAACPSS